MAEKLQGELQVSWRFRWLRFWASRFRISGFGFRTQGLELRVLDFGFRIEG